MPDLPAWNVRRASRQPLEQLAPRSQRLDGVGGGDRHSMIYLEAAAARSVVAITHDVGTRVPMASTAMGRAYLFSLPDVDRNKQIDAIRRRWRDDWTKVKTGLERSFKELGDRGFCVTWGEWLPELCGVGAPLRNSDGTAAYAINASAPIYQISRDRSKPIGPAPGEDARTSAPEWPPALGCDGAGGDASCVTQTGIARRCGDGAR